MDASPDIAVSQNTDSDAGPTGIVVQTSQPDPLRCTPLNVAVRRAIDAVRDETRALRADPTTDLKTFEYGKSQALLDLMRARALVAPVNYSMTSRRIWPCSNPRWRKMSLS